MTDSKNMKKRKHGSSVKKQQMDLPSQTRDEKELQQEKHSSPPSSQADASGELHVDPRNPSGEPCTSMEEEEVIINCVHDQDDEAWDSEADSVISDTSTPDYKRGKHDDELEQEAIREIRAESTVQHSKVNTRPPSLHVLADTRLEFWPKNDQICVLSYQPQWSFNQWIAALRAETVRVKCHTVLLYFEKVQDFQEVPPLKNVLHTMCKLIRQNNRSARIFISNLLPRMSGSPLGRPLVEVNFVLLQDVRSVNRATLVFSK